MVVSTNIRQQKNTSSSLQGVGAKENFFKKEKKTKLQVINNSNTSFKGDKFDTKSTPNSKDEDKIGYGNDTFSNISSYFFIFLQKKMFLKLFFENFNTSENNLI